MEEAATGLALPLIMEDTVVKSQEKTHFSFHHLQTLSHALWNLRTEGTMCDVVFDINGELLYGHRVVLGASSPVLKNSCLNPLSLSQDGLVLIKVEQHPYKVCLRILEFLYTGKQIDHEGQALDAVLKLCNEWQIDASQIMVKGNSNNNLNTQVNVENGQLTSSWPNMLMPCKPENQDVGDVSYEGGEMVPVFTSDTINANSTVLSQTSVSPNHPAMKRKRGRPRKVDTEYVKKTKKTIKASAKSNPGAQKKTNSKPKVVDDISAEDDLTSVKEEINDLFDAETDIEDIHPDVSVTNNDDDDYVPGSKTTNHNKNSKSQTKPNKVRKPRKVEPNEFGMYVCPLCPEEFVSSNELREHRKLSHKNKKTAWCKSCKLKFTDKNQLKAHDVEHHWQEGMEMPHHYICEEDGCNYQTYNKKSFSSHKSFVHHSERAICDICGKSLKNSISLRQHKQLVHVIACSKDYPCTACDKVFKSVCGLTRHVANIHAKGSGREKLICPHCGLTCLNETSMAEHLFKRHDAPPPLGKPAYRCKHCDFKTLKIRDIRNHELRHNPEKNFSCESCDKSYPTKRELSRHKYLHHSDKVKIFRCPHCPYITKYSRGALKSHIQVKHEENRPWTCTICSYSTKLKGNLHKHIRNVHKCEVKTNWTLPKVSQGQPSTNRYSNPKADTAEHSTGQDAMSAAVHSIRAGVSPEVQTNSLVNTDTTDIDQSMLQAPGAVNQAVGGSRNQFALFSTLLPGSQGLGFI